MCLLRVALLRQASRWTAKSGMQLCRRWRKLPQASAPQSWASSHVPWNWPCWSDGRDRRSQLGRPGRPGHGPSSRTHPCRHHLQPGLQHPRRLRLRLVLLLQSHQHRRRHRLRFVQFLQSHRRCRNRRRLHPAGLPLKPAQARSCPRTRLQGPCRPSRTQKSWSQIQSQSHLHPKMRTRSLKHVRCKRKLTQRLRTRFTSFAGSAWHVCPAFCSILQALESSGSCYRHWLRSPVKSTASCKRTISGADVCSSTLSYRIGVQAICQRSSGSGFSASALGGGMLHRRI